MVSKSLTTVSGIGGGERPPAQCRRSAAHSAALLCALVFSFATEVAAHDFSVVDTRLSIGPEAEGARRGFTAELIVDLDALLLGAGPGHDPDRLLEAIDSLEPEERRSREERLRQLFLRRARVLADGEPVDFEVRFPGEAASSWAQSFEAKEVSRLGVVAELSGDLPPEAETVGIRLSRAFGSARLRVVAGDREAPEQLVPPGTDSLPIELDALGSSAGLVKTSIQYARLGFLHILPRGVDHVLFLVALCLLPAAARRAVAAGAGHVPPDRRAALWSLLILVTLFTAAHAVTLALSIYGVVELPARVVEPLIAASIAVVAIETLASRRPTPALRRSVVFGFGLLHGLGFTSVLCEL